MAAGSATNMHTSHSTSAADSPPIAPTEKESTDAALVNYTWWLTAFTAMLAFATVALVIATIGLWNYAAEQAVDMKASVAAARLSASAAKESADAARESIKVAQTATEKQLRAYMGIQTMDARVFPFDQGGFTFIAHAEIRNFGQTPAYDLAVISNAVLDGVSANPFQMETEGNAKAAGLSIAFRDAGWQIQQWGHMTAEDVQALKDQKKRIYFWGTVRYRDAFDNRRKFTFRLVSNNAVIGSDGIYTMVAHPDSGFEAD